MDDIVLLLSATPSYTTLRAILDAGITGSGVLERELPELPDALAS
jgi:hypothetical protein